MKPNVLTIAGFDPSGGAGILADIKTFERCKCRGFAVQTGNTIQTEDRFYTVEWIPEEFVFNQLKSLLERYRFAGAKIGLMPSVSFLRKLLKILKTSQPQIQIIWDPIAGTSSGTIIHKEFNEIEEILSSVFMITPNRDEAKYFSNTIHFEEDLKALSHHTKILLKGGHNLHRIGVDELFYNGEIRKFNPKKGMYSPKHGSGCVFSAALLCQISKGYPLQKSILQSKRYVEKFLGSTKDLLGTHYR